MGCLKINILEKQYLIPDLIKVQGNNALTSEKSILNARKYWQARYYDGDVGRFLSLDPLAADYPSLSDYSYVAGNPILFIDPTGMAVEDIGIYTINYQGKVKHIKTVESEKEYDMVYRADDWENEKYDGEQRRINDQSVLSQLEYRGQTKQIASGEASSVMKLFKYAADNTNVEWTVAQGKVDGVQSTVIGTQNLDSKAIYPMVDTENSLGIEEGSLTLQIHSHPVPKRSREQEVSGMGKKIDGRYTGDWGVYRSYINYNNGKQFKYDVYMPQTGRLYRLNKEVGPQYIKQVNTYKDFQYKR